jgi:hypothetical protein
MGEPLMLYVGPDIPDTAPAVVREGLARRRLVWTTSGCPCGARAVQPNRATRRAMKRSGGDGVWPVGIRHAADCPAIAPETVAYVRGWTL